MKHLAKVFIWTSIVLVAVWIIPWVYRLATLESYSTPFTLYSCVVHDFTALNRDDGKFIFTDTKGNEYGDEVQPLFYHSVLASKGQLPDTLEGIAVDEATIKKNMSYLTVKPRNFMRNDPPVHLLMESVPVRLELHDPEYAMVARKDGIAIVTLATNEVEKEKTAAFPPQGIRRGLSRYRRPRPPVPGQNGGRRAFRAPF